MELSGLLANVGLGDIGFAGLVSLAIILILTGKLVPKTTVDELRASYEARCAASDKVADDWREAYQTTDQALNELGSNFGVLLEYAKTADHLIRSIQDDADGVKQ